MRVRRTTRVDGHRYTLTIDTINCSDGEISTTSVNEQLTVLYQSDTARPSYDRATRIYDELRGIHAHPVTQREKFIALAAEMLTR